MLRPHFHRIVLTGVLMAGFVGAGFVFGEADRPLTDTALPGPGFSLVIGAPTSSTAPASGDNETPRRATRARDQLSWPFFSFGRSGKRASW